MTDSVALLELVRSVLPSDVIDTADWLREPVAIVRVDSVLSTFARLRDEPELRFEMLCDLTAVDHLGSEPRFEVVYHLRSLSLGALLRIRVGVPEPAYELESVTSLWPAADWLEREVFDLFGIRFHGHPELRRILLQDEFEGHPLRKDYPRQRRQPALGAARIAGRTA